MYSHQLEDFVCKGSVFSFLQGYLIFREVIPLGKPLFFYFFAVFVLFMSRFRVVQQRNMQFFRIFFSKNLVISKKSSTFALAFEKGAYRLNQAQEKWCGSSVG